MNSLGVYLLVSLFFVVSTMFEFAVVLLLQQIPEWKAATKINYMREKNKRLNKEKRKIKNPDNSCDQKIIASDGWNDDQDKNDTRVGKNATHKIDVAALFTFSILYLLFNLTYWLYV
jgi:hypothetical protein